MRQIVSSLRTPPRLVDVPVPSLRSRGILVKVAFSAISVGTERSTAKSAEQGLIAKARSKPDKVLQVVEGIRKNGIQSTMQTVNDTLDKWTPLGYSCAGIVLEVGSEVSEFHVGDRVVCGGGGYASHGEFCYIPRRLAVKVPDSVPLDEASFATIGAIAMQGVRQAGLVLGERVAVLGLGIVGQLACQIASSAGCRVIAMDISEERVALARQLGAIAGVVINRDSALETILRYSDGNGVDAVILTAATSSNEPIRLAASLCRDRGRIVIVGDVGMGMERQDPYDKELEIRLSRSYGPGRYDPSYEERGNDYPIGYVRWTEQRNIQSYVELLESKRLQIGPLISHRFPIENADQAYASITGSEGARSLGVLLEYSETTAPIHRKVDISPSKPFSAGQPNIGFIGAGAFARSVLIPAIKGQPAQLRGIATASGLSGKEMAEKFGFEYAATDLSQILNDQNINTVFVATRHDTHASMAIDVLRAGKSVFVEKPLAVTLEDLEAVTVAQSASDGDVMVGFNRRFAPLMQEAMKHFGPNHGPLAITIRVNAGSMSRHWSQSADEGGGRIVGEGCHFVDLAQFIAGSAPASVYARSLPVLKDNLEESIAATIEFENGSLLNLTYQSVGSTKIEKEYIEIFGDGKAAILTDFSHLKLASGNNVKEIKGRQDKGHKSEIALYLQSLSEGKPIPVPFEQSVSSTLATLAILESCRSGKAVDPRTGFEVGK